MSTQREMTLDEYLESKLPDFHLARHQLQELRDEREALAAEAENWREAAAQYARNEDFYRGIVRQIGEMFGEAARTSDDGSVQEDVLALKVPELVEALLAHVERCRDVFSGLSEYWNGCEGMAAENAAQNATDVACDMLAELPETSLHHLKAQWQAEAVEHAMRLETHIDRVIYTNQLRRQAEEDA